MSSSSTTVQSQNNGTSQRGSRHRYRGPRHAGNTSTALHEVVDTAHPSIPISNSALAFTPSSVGPDRVRSNGTVGHGKGGRGRGTGGSIVQHMPGARSFVGQLTQEPSTAGPGRLHGDATEFTPGAAFTPRTLPIHVPRSRRLSKSQAPDIATRTHEDIANGLYECPICTNELMNNSKIWSCKTCWTCFHLSCVKKWAKNEGSTKQQVQPQNGEMPPPRQWRCPGCNLPKDDMPTIYTCWCAKEVEPRSIPGLPPHSCGQTCGKSRAPRKCPHPCNLLCHAGPCPPCSSMGPTQSCFCGKECEAKKCLDTDYEVGWSCGHICGDLLPCGEHACDLPCHEGLCGGCVVVIDSVCYCGKAHVQIPCCEREQPKQSTLPKDDGSEEPRVWEGSFMCAGSCGRSYDCGKHSCEKTCHEQTLLPAHCPRSPDVVSTCPCGKTSLDQLGCVRTSCVDDIPRCQHICERLQSCGHACQEKCHTSDCPPCLELTEVKCECGRTTEVMTCLEAQSGSPRCERTCRIALSCGRHECGRECCAAERTAIERQKRKAKAPPAQRQNIDDFEAEHICTRVCGRQLKCGDTDHVCQELCHRGPCQSCREAIFDEISCNCGRTVLQPPLPCGTTSPPCDFQCNRRKACGHPQIVHQCHLEDVSCPKCPYLVQKACMCGKAQLKNQPCSSTNVNCGQKCAKPLKCGLHFCSKQCHRPGDCEDAFTTACPQICGRAKTVAGCGHPCLDKCHALSPCPEDKPCQSKIIMTCDCQHLKKEVKCAASKTDSGNVGKSLTCDDECLRLQRNAKLANALNIPPDHLDDHIPYSTVTLELFKAHPKWSQTQEREFRVFAADADEKRLRFKPMTSSQRQFLHSLAEDFGFDSESVDQEPHRFVTVFRTGRFVSAPMKTLSQCVKIRKTQEEAALLPTRSANTVKPFNALLVVAPRFALTLEELRSAMGFEVPKTAKISFQPNEEIVITLTDDLAAEALEFESAVRNLKPALVREVAGKKLAENVVLCRVDANLNVMRREEDGGVGGGAGSGWSQVVKGVSAKQNVVGEGVGRKSAFTVLGRINGPGAGRKEVAKEEAVEDWEKDVDGWE